MILKTMAILLAEDDSKGQADNKPVSDSVSFIDKPANENLFDLSLLEEMDDNEYLSEILAIFLNNTPNELNELQRACTSHQFDAVYKIAHKLKSSIGLLKANGLLNILIKIEESARVEKNDGHAAMAELANEEYKKIEIPLKAHLRNIQA